MMFWKQLDTVQLRWMVRRDLPQVVAIENQSYEYPWTEQQFCDALSHRSTIGLVAEHDEEIVGFMVYQVQKRWLTIVNLAVRQNARRLGIGRKFLAKLESKLHSERRSIFVDVWERNLLGQQFFRSCGWKCRAIVPGAYETSEGTPIDAYQFVRRYSEVCGLDEVETRKLSDASFTEKT